MVKKMYCYNDGDQVILSHDIPPKGIKYIEKIISVIGVPDLRAVTIKDSDGITLYNNLDSLPLENNFEERYFAEGNRK